MVRGGRLGSRPAFLKASLFQTKSVVSYSWTKPQTWSWKYCIFHTHGSHLFCDMCSWLNQGSRGWIRLLAAHSGTGGLNPVVRTTSGPRPAAMAVEYLTQLLSPDTRTGFTLMNGYFFSNCWK